MSLILFSHFKLVVGIMLCVEAIPFRCGVKLLETKGCLATMRNTQKESRSMLCRSPQILTPRTIASFGGRGQ